MTITPDALEGQFSLATAVARLQFLSRRDGGTTPPAAEPLDEDDWSSSLPPTATSLDVSESLELLALGEVVARRAHDAHLVGIRAALRGGASWEQVAAALDTSPGAAWDAFRRAVERAAHEHDRTGEGLDAAAVAAALDLAGPRPE